MVRPAYSSFALALLSAVATPVLAQPVPGGPGERSRSVIRISVSVAPAFKRVAPSEATDGPSLTAIDQSLRYALVTQPMIDKPSFDANGGRSRAGTLVLVVPD